MEDLTWRDDYRTRIGRRIERARLNKGWTKHRLAQEVGAHDSQVSQWERGLHMPNPPRLEQIARALGVTAEWFLRDDDDDVADEDALAAA